MRSRFSNYRVFAALIILAFSLTFIVISLYQPVSNTSWQSISSYLSRKQSLVYFPSNKVKADDLYSSSVTKQVFSNINTTNDERRKFIIEMTKHAWDNYRNLAWGANELSPLSKTPKYQLIFGGPQMMATVIDGADTLWIMGLHKEYIQARDRIRDFFNVSQVAINPLSVFEITIRHIGGLLSLYALAKEKFYITKAKQLADVLLPAFDTPTGIARSFVDPRRNISSNYGWASGGSSILSEFGSLHMEFVYLSELTGDPLYRDKVKKIRNVLDEAEKKLGLYPTYISPDTGKFVDDHVTLGALGDSFFELLLKSWLHTGKQDEQAYKMYKESSKAIRKNMVFQSKGGLVYLAELTNGLPDHKMTHLACFAPGMFALESTIEKDKNSQRRIIDFAEKLAHTCHESYIRSTTRIGPEVFYFDDGLEAITRGDDAGYILRPESIESWFYLWRITRKEKYKDWVWDAVLAINRFCRVENGFVGLRNVYKPEQGYDDVQQSFFLAETLKYAYLTFTDDKIPLDQWVFNTEAHPFPISNTILY